MFTHYLRSLAEYVAELADIAMADFPTLDTLSTMRLIHMCHGAETKEHADNYRSILTAAVMSTNGVGVNTATGRHAIDTTAAIGTVAPLRADHLRIIDRPFDAEGDIGTVKPADPFHAVTTAVVKRSRSKRGTSTVVVRNGRSLLTVGRTAPDPVYVHETADGPDPVYGSIVPRCIIEHAIEQCRGPLGYDGIALARVATFAYDLPTMIGLEHVSKSQVIPATVACLLDAGAIAKHTTGAYDGLTRHNVSTRQWSTRVQLPALRARKGEYVEGSTPAADVAHRVTVAGSTVRDDDGRVIYRVPTRTAVRSVTGPKRFDGHTAIVRPATRAATRVARSYSEAFILKGDALAALADVATVIGKGDRVTWSTDDRVLEGTLTRSARGYLSATVKGASLKPRSCRTVAALLKHVAPEFV